MRYRRRKRIQNGNAPSSTGQMMNLSLFIMLLAFFIVLNSISSFQEEKASKVRQSIEDTFSLKIVSEGESSSLTPSMAQSVNEGDSFERIEALFQSQLSGFETKKNVSRGTMMVDIPYSVFEKAMNAIDQVDLTQTPSRAQGRENFFVPTLSSIMRSNVDGAPTRMEIYMNILDNPAQMQNEDARDVTKLILMLGNFSKTLQANDVPEKLINIGIKKGNPKNVTLVFRKYKAFSLVEVEDVNE